MIIPKLTKNTFIFKITFILELKVKITFQE